MSERPSLQGRKLGDRRVEVPRPHARYFRYLGSGHLEAKLEAQGPRTAYQRRMGALRRLLFGRPLPSGADLTERLPRWKALPTFSSDVMSSVAYASGASMFILLGAGKEALGYLMPLSLAVVALLLIVTFSYRQTIRAYPNGGGSYIVAHANLGVLAGLIAAASLLTDYVLTVAVSVSSGVQNLYSAFPGLMSIRVLLIVLFIAGVMAINLRGLRESGTIFAAPTYIFLGSMLVMIGLGLFGLINGGLGHVSGLPLATGVAPQSIGIFLLARAFADGCSAMTGTEAVANGVPAFKPPEWRNAQSTMLTMAILLGVMFLGTSLLANAVGAVPTGDNGNGESVLSQIARTVFGAGSVPYFVLAVSTMGILILAAQTSFADFPRLSSILAHDEFFPRQFALRGERLAFNTGIVALGLIAMVLVVAFGGNVNNLIGLYAIGVFTSFTLSQAGMVRHWFRERSAGWRRNALINGVGALTTAIVVLIIGIFKFSEGVWIVLIIVPVLVIAMLLVRREYNQERAGLEVSREVVFSPPVRRQRVVIFASAFNRAVIQAIKVGQTMSSEIQLVHVALDPAEGEVFHDRVIRQISGVRVVLVESPYRAIVRPFVRYLEVSAAEDPEQITIVLLPEHLARHWWDRLLYNANSHRIRAALVGRRDFVVLDVPYRRDTRGPVDL
jgi:amino acid transporter